MLKGACTMTHYPHSPMSSSHPFPSDRYTQMNPLLRQFGLRLLSESMPDLARLALLRAWMHPARFDGNQAIQSLHRQRPAEASFSFFPPSKLRFITEMELAVSRRIAETSRTAIT